MESIKQVIMERDGISSREADELIAEARNALNEYLAEDDMDSAENICEEFFGLEMDYLPEILGN